MEGWSGISYGSSLGEFLSETLGCFRVRDTNRDTYVLTLFQN